MGDDRWTVGKLEGDSNWMTWKVQMRHLMLDRNLWSYVDGTTMMDPGAEEKLQLEFKRQKALTAIILSISTPIVPIVQSCTTPVEAWEALRGAFEKCTLAAKLHLRKKYFQMEMQEGGNVKHHIREMKQITDRHGITNLRGRQGNDPVG